MFAGFGGEVLFPGGEEGVCMRKGDTRVDGLHGRRKERIDMNKASLAKGFDCCKRF